MGVPLSTFAAARTPPSTMVGCWRETTESGMRVPTAVTVTVGEPGFGPRTRFTQAKPKASVGQEMVEVAVVGVQAGSPSTVLNVIAPRGLTAKLTGAPSTGSPTASRTPTLQ